MAKRRLTPPPNREAKKPKLQAPAGACDCHFHLFGPKARFPFAEGVPLDAEDCPLEDLIEVQARLGLDRGVIVQTLLYGTDNRVIVDALSRFPERFRAVVAVDTPGTMVGRDVEKTGLVRHCARLFVTGANLETPRFGVADFSDSHSSRGCD